MNTHAVDQLFNESDDLPSLSPLFKEIEKAIADPHSNAKSIADLIGKDPSISAKILKVVNSPSFGLREPTHSISRAVAILGTLEVSRIVMGISVINAFDQTKYPQVDFGNFWLHSIAVSLAAKSISQLAPRGLLKDPELVFVGGLLHDIGKLVLWTKFPEYHQKIVARVASHGISVLEAENHYLNCDHQAIGARIASHWRMPESLQLLIRYHDAPQNLDLQDPWFPLVSVIHLADLIVKAMEIGWSGDDLVPKLFFPSIDILNISLNQLEEITHHLNREAFQLTRLIFS